MSPRTGRPKAVNPKNLELRVRIDRETSEILEELAKHYNEPKSVVVRNAIQQLYAKTKKYRACHSYQDQQSRYPESHNVQTCVRGRYEILFHHTIPGAKSQDFANIGGYFHDGHKTDSSRS